MPDMLDVNTYGYGSQTVALQFLTDRRKASGRVAQSQSFLSSRLNCSNFTAETTITSNKTPYLAHSRHCQTYRCN